MESNLEELMPTITIAITAYNRPEMLREAVLSVLNQTYGNFQLLIGNDYIETPITFESLGIDPDPRVRILNYSSNLGEICNMNHMLELSKTEWFVWMADDDLFHQSFLELSINSISPESEVVAVYSAYTFGANLNKEFFYDIKTLKIDNLTQSVFISKYTSREIKIIGCYGLMKTSKLKEVGGMPSLGTTFGPYGDTLVPILLSKYGSINYLTSPLCFLRTHDESLSATSIDVNEYSCSASNFLTELYNVCLHVKDINIEKCVYNMVSWFRDDEFSVISRNNSISKYRSGYNFICNQFKNNYSKINIRYWFGFTIRNLNLVAVLFIKIIYKKIRA